MTDDFKRSNRDNIYKNKNEPYDGLWVLHKSYYTMNKKWTIYTISSKGEYE